MADIVLATRNKGKLVEIRAMLNLNYVNLLSLDNFPHIGDIPEEGATFEDNALAKANIVARLSGKIAMADDSGISVEALDGKPGVMSARFAGEGSSDARNNALLLKEMKSVPEGRRGATFVCVIAVVAGARELVVRGECPGTILEEGRGAEGFGYDPLFYYPPMQKTFSEMSAEEKNNISHRRKAIEKLKERLPAFLGMGDFSFPHP